MAAARLADVPPRSSLTASAPPSLTKRIAVRDRLFVGHLVGPERQVGHQQRPGQAAVHGAHQDEELIDGDSNRARVAEHDVGGAVAHQHDVDAGGVDDLCRRVVVGGDHHDGAALGLPRHQVRDAHRLRLRGGLDMSERQRVDHDVVDEPDRPDMRGDGDDDPPVECSRGQRVGSTTAA